MGRASALYTFILKISGNRVGLKVLLRIHSNLENFTIFVEYLLRIIIIIIITIIVIIIRAAATTAVAAAAAAAAVAAAEVVVLIVVVAAVAAAGAGAGAGAAAAAVMKHTSFLFAYCLIDKKWDYVKCLAA